MHTVEHYALQRDRDSWKGACTIALALFVGLAVCANAYKPGKAVLRIPSALHLEEGRDSPESGE